MRLFVAFLSGDSFLLYDAVFHWTAYPFFAVAMVLGIAFFQVLWRLIPAVDQYMEKTILVVSYLSIAMIIFVEVIRRFVFQLQAPWSTTLPPYLFLLMSWFGCAYNVRLRFHLSFDELRMRLSRNLQFCCLVLDALLWIGFSWVVIVTSMRITVNSASNFQILLGTDDVMQWWFYICVPIAWTILAARAAANLVDDYRTFKEGSGSMVVQKSLFGD